MKKIIFVLLLFVSTLFANIGTITLLEGEAFVKRAQETVRLKLSDTINNNDFIETKANSKVKITFIDNTIITIGKESSLKIEEYLYDSSNQNSSKSEFNISKGAFHAITGQIGKVNPEKFKLKTKNATIGIRGTEFYGDENRIVCTQGAITVFANNELVDVPAGNYINIFENKKPDVQPILNDSLDEIDEKLNTNNTSSNQTIDNFNNNPSSPLALSNTTNNKVSFDNQNSWGDWDTNLIALNDEKNSANKNQQLENTIKNNTEILSLTPTEYIANLLDLQGETTLTFNGHFSGAGVTDAGSINLNFTFGSSTNILNGTYNFEHTSGYYNDDFSNNMNAIHTDYRGGSNQYFFEASGTDAIVGGQFYGNTMNSVQGTLENFDITIHCKF